MNRVELNIENGYLVFTNLNNKSEKFVCEFLTDILTFVKTLDYVIFSEDVTAMLKSDNVAKHIKDKLNAIETQIETTNLEQYYYYYK